MNILAKSRRQGGRYSKRSKVNASSTFNTKGGSEKCGLQRGDEGLGGEDRGDNGKADFIRG